MIEAKSVLVLVKATVLCVLLAFGPNALAGEQPKLILQITVDALRGDLPGRFDNVLSEGGFRYLMNDASTTATPFKHANTETIVGHTSLATGTVPAAHGMIGNVWFDRELDHLAYNIEDANYHLLTVGADVDQKTEIDPTQRAANVTDVRPTIS